MKILLVEPEYRKGKPKKQVPPNDDTLWYPPIGLLKLAYYHRILLGDEVYFVTGCDPDAAAEPTLFDPGTHWDRIYITTLFTFHFDKIIDTIKFYLNAVGGTVSKIYVGGIMASLMREEIEKNINITLITGLLNSARMIGMDDDTNIDQLPCDYSVIDHSLYAINDTYYTYTTRGCENHCPWCGVPTIEPKYLNYIDIKPYIANMRIKYGDKPVLKLMDNNILASQHLPDIVKDLLELGYGKGELTKTDFPKIRTIDFNQGLDATHINNQNMALLSQLNIKPMRIAFDRVKEMKVYTKAVRTAIKYGVTSFSNYMLYNFKDSPRDLYERLLVNIELNEEFLKTSDNKNGGAKIYSYPMRYAPINDNIGGDAKKRDFVSKKKPSDINWFETPIWTERFIRNIEIMKGAVHGAISPTPTLARRTIGHTFSEFITNLYMPEELLRNRNKHERRVYDFEPKRKPGTGNVEKFRAFLLDLLKKQDSDFHFFHNVVSPNSVTHIRMHIDDSPTKEIKKWLKLYLGK